MVGTNYLPFLAMVIVQIGYAGTNITSKLALETGMNPIILVAYRQIFATLAITPFAYLLEWKKSRPKLTKHVLFLIFLCSTTGATMNQMFYLFGLNNSTPTIGCALTNTLPAITFVLAVLFRQECVRIKTKPGQAKVLGTIVCVGGAMLLSFYHGKIIGMVESTIHWKYVENMTNSTSINGQNHPILGPIFVIASSVATALWFIIQTKVSKKFPAPYTSTAIMCLMSSVECSIIGIIFHHKKSAWSLTPTFRLISILYAAVMCSALAFSLVSWTIQRKGPLYVSVFNPLLLVIVAVLSWALLHEKLYVGTATGSLLIVGGLYLVLWGKDKDVDNMILEDTELIELDRENNEKDDLELQSFKNGKKNVSLQCKEHNTKHSFSVHN